MCWREACSRKRLAVLFSVFTILASLGIGSSVQAIFDQCGNHGTDTGIAAYHRHGSGGACGEGDHRWQPADWKSMYLAGSCDECILFRRMYFYPYEKLCGDPGGSKMIVTSAFVPEAAAGGVVGTTVMAGLRTGFPEGFLQMRRDLVQFPWQRRRRSMSHRGSGTCLHDRTFWGYGRHVCNHRNCFGFRYDCPSGQLWGCRGSGCVFAVFRELPVGAMRCCRFHWSCLRLRRSSDGMSMASAPCGICLGKRVSAFTRSFI